ncbi:MAG: FAD/NAD(P)-binding protein [Chloroflexi bacterium]|nr:FAD/NAD(P)-binding protein [Chloroflexota bacterium]
MNNPLIPEEAVILHVEEEAQDVSTYTLALKDRERQSQFWFKPGQFNMLSLVGLGEIPVSMSSDPTDRAFVQHTVKTVGSMTSVLARLGRGDVVGLRGPYGSFWPLEEAGGHDVAIVAGGIGIAPLRPVLEHIFGNRTVYGQVTVLCGARTPGDLVFSKDFHRWSTQPDTRLLLTVDRVDGQPWAHYVGVVPTLFEKVKLSRGTVVFACGPEVMLRFTVLDLLKRGHPAAKIFVSMERRMQCGIAQCGHCFFGPKFVCRDGPVFRLTDVIDLLGKGV